LFLKFFSVLLFIIFNCLWSKPQLINEWTKQIYCIFTYLIHFIG
jgi:hypothetical protein